jgi:NitT/TauT family transport system substrate-binding protein
MSRQDLTRHAPEGGPSRPGGALHAVTRRQFLGTAAGVAAGAAALGGLAPASGARAQTRIKIGYLPLLAVGPLYVANDRGYLRDAGLDVEMVRFAAGVEMAAALGTGELTAGYAAVSPALFNAWTRGVRTMVVLDAARFRPGYGTILTMVRNDLADVIRSPQDLRGRRVSLGLLGSAIDYVMRQFLEQNGLTEDDVDGQRLANVDVNAGLAGRSLDAAGIGEPFGAMAEQNGIARRWIGGDQITPGLQLACLLVSEQAVRDRALTTALVTAYLRGIREFVPNQTSDPAILEIVNRWTGVPPDTIRQSVPSYADPNGGLDVDDLRRQEAFWLRHGIVSAPSAIDERIDLSFAEAAVQTLGRA